MRLAHTSFTSVHPVGETGLPWPPYGWTVRPGLVFFTPVVIDMRARMKPEDSFVQHDFPAKGEMTAVMPTPSGMRAYHVAPYGMWWPTDPAKREQAERGGCLGGH